MLPLPNMPLLDGGVLGVPPPPNFRDGVGVISAQFSALSYFEGGRGNSPAKRAGIAYERKVHRHFSSFWPKEWRTHPWIRFSDKSGSRYCCPDALLVSPRRQRCIIVEVKYTHTSDAWWQLRKLYEPVVQKIFGARLQTSILEITKSYDPAIPFPEPIDFLRKISDVWRLDGKMGVFVWKP